MCGGAETGVDMDTSLSCTTTPILLLSICEEGGKEEGGKEEEGKCGRGVRIGVRESIDIIDDIEDDMGVAGTGC